VFQAAMPLIGYLIGSRFQEMIEAYDHWIAFALLLFLGSKMLFECLRDKDEIEEGASPDAEVEVIMTSTTGTHGTVTPIMPLRDSMSPSHMLPLAIATSIDALALGISFAFLNVSIGPAVSFIGVTTFTLSAVGVNIGRVFGVKWKKKAEITGGIILILIGLKILLEHLGILTL
jgi:putative Mn2+ efflux pump MntP